MTELNEFSILEKGTLENPLRIDNHIRLFNYDIELVETSEGDQITLHSPRGTKVTFDPRVSINQMTCAIIKSQELEAKKMNGDLAKMEADDKIKALGEGGR